jgi:NADH-quinone oxidoreductase subunit H
VSENIFILILRSLATIGGILGFAAYAVLAERKIAARIQRRPGPNRTNMGMLGSIPVLGSCLTRLGLFQPMADGLKFLFKEDPIPGHVNKLYYLLAPLIAFIPAMVTIVVLPFGSFRDAETGVTSFIILADLDIGILFYFAISSLCVYGTVLAGWASNSKYSFLGGVRASAQLISYEMILGLSVLPVFLWHSNSGNGSLSLAYVASQQNGAFLILPNWTIFYQPLSGLLFFVALVAETNRLPFDMPESETDLVAGFNTEYGSLKFGLFFLAEYSHIFIGSGVFVALFLGGWNLGYGIAYPPGVFGALLGLSVFLLKTCSMVFLFIWIRWTLPRFRYDQVMHLCWQKLMPIAVLNLFFYAIAIAILESVQGWIGGIS